VAWSTFLTRGDPLVEVTKVDGCQTLGFGVAVLPEVSKKTDDRVELWSKGERPEEWAGVYTGNISVSESGEVLLIVDDLIELPSYGLHREHGISICLEHIRKIADNRTILGFVHSHTSEDLTPSANDLAISLYIETAILQRPILHAIVSPNGRWLVFSLKKCHGCPNSFFELLKSEGSKVKHDG
jgi:proteasome lid subunit RPN8/RPN11